jgi:predicted nucleic acid-binding protein
MDYVIDASVAAKWCLPAVQETLVAEANELLRRQSDGSVRFVVPDLFWGEMADILWKAVRVERCTRESAESSLVKLKQRQIPTIGCESLVEQAFGIAVTYDRSAYDSFYVALALEIGGQLVTADERLANALAARLPVKWLGGL